MQNNRSMPEVNRLSEGNAIKKTILFCVLLLLTSSCSRPSESVPPSEARIGVIAYLKGEQVTLAGRPTINAVQMAVEDLEASGGLTVAGRKQKIRIVVEGVDNVPEQTVAAAERLINQEGVFAIIGPQFSGDAIPTGGVAEAAKIPMICPIATNPRVTLGREWVFRMSFVDDFQGEIMALFARRDLGAKRAAVLFDVANAYNRDVAEVFRRAFEREGGTVLAFESYTTGVQDFEPPLRKIKKLNPDVLFLPNYSSDAQIQGEQARQVGIKSVLLGSDGWDQRSLQGLDAFDGSFMPVHWSPFFDDPRTQRFIREYREKFNEAPNDTAALTYDALGLLFRVVKEQNSTDPARVGRGIATLGPFEGVTGRVDFIENGNPRKGAFILRFTGGQGVFYKQVPPLEPVGEPRQAPGY